MSPAGATILVVDDEPVVLETVRDGLTAHGYQVLSAGGGEEALQIAQAHQGEIALALVDVVMPGMGGPGSCSACTRPVPILRFSSCPASRPRSSWFTGWTREIPCW